MIEELSIQNYALIEKARVEFAPGLNILTGETGAGKSILIGALGLLLGSKADAEVIRSGAEEASVSAVIEAGGEDLDLWMEASGLAAEDGKLLLRRVIRPQKRGGCYVGSSPVTRSQLEELTSYLVDLHGQHEHQSLFSTDHHRRLLDRFLGIDGPLKVFAGEFTKLTQMNKDLLSLTQDEAGREEEIFRLKQMIGEIIKAGIQEGEEAELKAEKRRLDQHEKLYGELEALQSVMGSGRPSALQQLKHAKSHLQAVAAIDEQWEEALQRLENAYWELDDIAQNLHTYTLRLNFSPDRLEDVNGRLGLLHSLEKRYGPTLSDVLSKAEEAKERLAVLENYSSVREKAEKAAAEQEQKVIRLAMDLSEKRQAGAKELQVQILGALADLGMARAQFQISFQRRIGDTGKPICSATGLDLVEFLMSANPGEPLKPLKDIASGGELSRVTLALKTILSDADNVPILIFDEIDTGIGGEMGQALGKYLKRLSKRKQVLCITHLASIASFADHHLKIEKKTEGQRTLTMVNPVSGEARVQEIARMLSGNAMSDSGLQHARELVNQNALGG